MRLNITTWDSHNINDTTNYQSGFSPGNAMPSATATFIDLGQSDAILAGKTLDGGYLTFYIVLRGSIEAQRDTINGWFRPNDFTFRNLVAQDLDNSNKEWYVTGYPITPPLLSNDSTAQYTVTLALKQPYWIESSLQTNTWSITAGTETESMTNAGNMPALPTFEITPVQAKASNDLKYKTFYAIHTSGWEGSIPVDITSGGLDTATLTTAKMRADGYDVGVSVDGVYVDRWFGGGGFDTATTEIWINMTFKPAPTMTLTVALAGAGTPATLKATFVTGVVISMPQNSTLQIGTELITYSSYTIDYATNVITFIPVSRNAKGSSIAAHSIGDSVYWIEHEVWLTYGNSSASAPVIDDRKKPAFDLTTSTNASWVYTSFGESTGLRTASPTLTGIRSNYVYEYTGNRGANADPYTELGLYASSREQGNQIYNIIARLSWDFSHPGGISNFVASGEKYRSSTAWNLITLTNKRTGGTIYDTIATPSVVSTWEAVSISEALADNPISVLLQMTGGLGTTSPVPYVMIELESATQTNYAPPTCTAMGVEQSNYKLSGSLLNDTNDESIIFNDLITKTSNTITIDCAEQEVYSADGKRLRGMISFGGDKRDEWLTFNSGANSMVFTDTGTVEVTIVTKWRGRNTI